MIGPSSLSRYYNYYSAEHTNDTVAQGTHCLMVGRGGGCGHAGGRCGHAGGCRWVRLAGAGGGGRAGCSPCTAAASLGPFASW